MKVLRRQSGFTLIELLAVIAILGVVAALSVPAIKALGKSNANIAASRQLLNDIARARQLAMSQRTTVYMVFVPTNFWNTASGAFNSTWFDSLSLEEKNTATNLVDLQMTGYTFVSLRAVGDQPGQNNAKYLGRWLSLPEGAFIAAQKFSFTNAINDPTLDKFYPIARFNYTNIFPFPTETAGNVAKPFLPYIAFNYLGQLTFDGQSLAGRDEYIPLAKGNVGYGVDPETKKPRLTTVTPNDIIENPPGNSTNAYNIVRIDRLTGRATLEFQKVQ